MLLVEKEPKALDPRQEDVWITRSGRLVPMLSLSDGHLVNALRWMHKTYDVYLRGLPLDLIPLLLWQMFPKADRMHEIAEQRGLDWRQNAS